MNFVRLALVLVAAGLCALAAPAHAQQPAVAPTQVPSRLDRPALPPLPAALSARVDAPVASHAEALEEAEARRLPLVAYPLIGAAAGALVGLSVMALSPDCWSPDSMCGMVVPAMAGAGAVAGGAVGLVIGVIRTR